MKSIIDGKLFLYENGRLLKYIIYRGFDTYDLDIFLWNNLKNYIDIKISNNNTGDIFEACGKLFVDYKNGYEKFYIKNNNIIYDLDDFLWNSINNTIELVVVNGG